MKKQEMVENLTQNSKELREELIQLQESFNTKKEQLMKIEGALEALSILTTEEISEETLQNK